MIHLQYISYVARHKWFVFVAGRKIGVSLWQLLIHDWSKFTPIEWRAYVDYFYGEQKSVMKAGVSTPEFDAAWLHHQHRNPHHWQHWILRRDDGTVEKLDMPERFVYEMVADWAGAGRAITGRWDLASWYQDNRRDILISEATRALVEDVIDWFESKQDPS